MSAREALRAIRFWMSVLQNTPHRDAIGYTCVALSANAPNSSGETPRRMAIWSMNAPVPPAQLAVHPQVGGCPSEKNTFGKLLATDVYHGGNIRMVYSYILCGSHHLLHEGQRPPFGDTHSHRSGKTDGQFRLSELFPYGPQAAVQALPDFRLMSLINIQHDTPAFPVDQHCFQCG